MIRLKASELTLTPADVEETRRRIERRQAANAPATLPARLHGPSLPPGLRARLRRGPRRARGDDITSLGLAPVLRPQQAVHSSVDDPGDPPRPARGCLAGSSEAVSGELTRSPLLSSQTTLQPSSTSTALAVPHSGGEVRLPFRSTAQERESSLVASQGDTSDDTPAPSKVHLSPPRLGRARANSSEPSNDDVSLTRYHALTDGNFDNATLPETPMRNPSSSFRECDTHITSLQHVQRTFPRLEGFTGDVAAQRATSELSEREASSNPRFIRGYWDSHQRYRFIECAPQTEPRLQTTQPSTRNRTVSSSSEPLYQPRVRRPDTSDSSTAGDVFWNAPAPGSPSTRDTDGVRGSTGSSNDRYWSPLGTDGMGYGDPIRATTDRHSSGTSSTSQPYSFYELPGSSRHSSSTYSQPDIPAQSQYDGAASSHQSSREASRGAYYSIRLPQSRVASGAYLRPPPPSRLSSTSSPDLTALSQHRPSPLPSRPYSQIASTQHRPIPSTGLISIADFVGGDQDAARAVQRDLSSPLELIQERAHAYFERISARVQVASSQNRTAEPRTLTIGDVGETANTSRVAGHQRRYSGSGGLWHEHDNSTHSRIGARARARMDYTPMPVENPTVQVRISHVPRRTAPAARVNQRSSENAAVELSAQDTQSLRMPTQRASVVPPPTHTDLNVAMRGGEFSTSPVTARFSVPQLQRPRDVSNRPHMYSPYPVLLASNDAPSGSDSLNPVPSSVSRLTPPSHPNPFRDQRIASRHTSRQDLLSDDPRQQPTRRTVTPILAPLPFSRRSERGLPSTSTTLDSASGVTSRRSQVARAATRRQIMHEQENSEERERQDMGGELAGAEWRLGTEGRTDIMEETPPRMGRYERFTFD